MIGITIVFIGITSYEMSFLIRHKRKPRTYWITGSCIVAAYLYLTVIYLYQDLPSSNQLIEYLFHFQ
ncbi:hypothetical protein PAENIP36_58640 [Paenibacillus sp. P36]